MGRKKTLATAEVGARAQAELDHHQDARLHVRLLAVVQACQWPLAQVAAFIGVAPDSIRRWVKRFAQEGVAGLKDRPRGHNPSKLLPEHVEQIRVWLNGAEDAEGTATHWTIALLQAEILRRWSIQMSSSSLQRHVWRLGFRLKVPRPAHTKADPAAQAAFKKKRPPRSLNS